MRYPLRFLIPAALVVTGLIIAVAVALTSQRLSDSRSEQVVTELLTTIGNLAAADVAAGLRADDPVHVRGALEHLQVLRGLDLGLLVNDANLVIYATQSAYVGRQLDFDDSPVIAEVLRGARASRAANFRFHGDTLYYGNYIAGALPAFLGGGMANRVLLLKYNYAALRASQRVAATNEALIIATGILLLSGLSWLFLRKVLLGRIAELVDASNRIGSGDLVTPVPKRGKDEIAILGKAMDLMRSELLGSRERIESATRDLKATKAEIERERASLADRVATRTRDLTIANRDLARARDEAEAASRAKSAFLATISHEIRTPMNGVMGAMELLERSGLDEYRAPLLKTAQDSAGSLLALLNDLLDMAKIEAGRIEISLRPADLRLLVKEVAATHAPVAVAKKLNLKTDIAEAVPANVMIDGLRVKQILGNFLSNAIKFTQKGEIEVAVAAEQLQDRQYLLKFAVTDTGPGIPSEFMGSLFTPFEQYSTGSSGRDTGSGLGLAICRGLASSMGGTVKLLCPPNGGTQAILELVVSPASSPADPPERESAGKAAILKLMEKRAEDAEPIRVLVVDDHPANRLLQIRQLEQLGLLAISAVDGNDALQQLTASPIDVIITDCDMPVMDGYELARSIRDTDGPHKDIPIIACTAHSLSDVSERCRKSGINGILTKPMRLGDLASILHKFWPNRVAFPENVASGTNTANDLLINDEQMMLLSSGDEQRREKLIDSLLSDTEAAIESIRLALNRSDFTECRAIAHRHKGACSMYGAEPLSQAFANLEYWSRQKAPVQQHIRRALQRVAAELEKLRATSSSSA